MDLEMSTTHLASYLKSIFAIIVRPARRTIDSCRSVGIPSRTRSMGVANRSEEIAAVSLSAVCIDKSRTLLAFSLQRHFASQSLLIF